ncbi:hypothetical protein PAE4_20340 [Bacillus altitudinis]|nr:hypothetical protein PAE4_20340 [Bacillus altitudinis]
MQSTRTSFESCLYKNSPFRLIIHIRRKGSMIISDLIEMREIDRV